jgi:hypothetical protein
MPQINFEINLADPLWPLKLYADWWRLTYKALGFDDLHGAMLHGTLDGYLRPKKKEQ